MAAECIALIDIGKTTSKLVLVDVESGQSVQHFEHGSSTLAGSLGQQLDVGAIETWLAATFAALPRTLSVRAVVPIAHGAAAVLLDAQQQVLAAPDYDDAQFDQFAPAYQRLRDPFSATLSPSLGRGLNLGRQLHWLSQRAPQVLERCTQILTYPQYWAWRLGGSTATECTSLGCHTDLWRPLLRSPSVLAQQQGWSERLAPLQSATTQLGTLRADWARAAGIRGSCRVLCGMHDSSASFLAHAITQPDEVSFSVVSSGTWTIIMSRNADLTRLREPLDMLANVDIQARPVATARFAGGREFAVIAGASEHSASHGASLQPLLQSGAMALPAFDDHGGPFASRRGELLGVERLDAGERTQLAALYVALMSDLLLDWLAAPGDVLLDGPLAENLCYASILAALRPQQTVYRAGSRHGIAQAALQLAGYAVRAAATREAVSPAPERDALLDHRRIWRARLPL